MAEKGRQVRIGSGYLHSSSNNEIELTPDQMQLPARQARSDFLRRTLFVPTDVYDIGSTQQCQDGKNKEGNGPFQPEIWRKSSNDEEKSN